MFEETGAADEMGGKGELGRAEGGIAASIYA